MRIACVMSNSITVKFMLPVPAERIYTAWLDSAEHSAMTGAKATCSREVGGEFTAWDGYIHGKNLLLIENKKIVQSWRSSDFPEDASDSVLSIQLLEREGITEVVLEHSDIPPERAVDFQSGWIEYYANPMQKYFAAGKATKKGKALPKPANKTPKRRSSPVKSKGAARNPKSKKAVAKAKKKSAKAKAGGRQ